VALLLSPEQNSKLCWLEDKLERLERAQHTSNNVIILSPQPKRFRGIVTCDSAPGGRMSPTAYRKQVRVAGFSPVPAEGKAAVRSRSGRSTQEPWLRMRVLAEIRSSWVALLAQAACYGR